MTKKEFFDEAFFGGGVFSTLFEDRGFLRLSVRVFGATYSVDIDSFYELGIYDIVSAYHESVDVVRNIVNYLDEHPEHDLWYDLFEVFLDERLWYAVLKDQEDNDLGFGSYDFQEAVELLYCTDSGFIAVVRHPETNYSETLFLLRRVIYD